jgi:hypothetical protein
VRVNVNVKEQRAPTDESVRLLREMEQAAQSKVLASFRLEDCPVDCIVHHMHSMTDDEERFIVQYRIGGGVARVPHVHRSKGGESEREGRERLIGDLVRVVGESIAARLLATPLQKALRRI